MREPVFRFPTRSVQPMKMASGFKFRIQEVEGLYMYYMYQYSKNKIADQLHNSRRPNAPLFLLMQKAGFLIMWLNL